MEVTCGMFGVPPAMAALPAEEPHQCVDHPRPFSDWITGATVMFDNELTEVAKYRRLKISGAQASMKELQLLQIDE